MMTNKEALDLAVKAGLDKEKFFGKLKEQGLDPAESLQEEELDSVSGGEAFDHPPKGDGAEGGGVEC